MSSIDDIGWRPRLDSAKSHYVLSLATQCVVHLSSVGWLHTNRPCFPVNMRMFMLSNEDTYMNFNLNTVDVPSNEDGPRSSDIGNDFNIT